MAYHLGTFSTLDEARKARKEAEERLHAPYIKKYDQKHSDKSKS